MWKFAFSTALICVAVVKCQDQFLREVKNPTGPSISVLRGGGFPRNSNVEDLDLQALSPKGNAAADLNGNQVEEKFRLVDDEGVPIEDSVREQPIPEDPNKPNPFTSGVHGVGLRLQAQPEPQPLPVKPSPPTNPLQNVGQQNPPQLQLQPQLIPLTAEQLVPGQTYIDLYGRPFVHTAQQPQPSVEPIKSQNKSIPKQALVDTYGRKINEIEPQPVAIVPAAAPVIHETVQPVLIENVVAPAVQKVVPPSATLQTYAIPTVKKVGNLVVPFAQKIVVASKIPAKEVVYPAPVAAHALVKSRHRTILSPIENPVHIAPELVHTPVTYVHEPHPPQPHIVQVVNQPQQHIVAQQQQVLVQPQVHFQQAVPNQVTHVTSQYQPLQVVENYGHAIAPVATAPVLVEQVKPVVPEVTLIRQPILRKAEFQQLIFNVKHGSEPVVYQDLCTVYPYQKNIRACVLKKAVLPEIHHPDIRTVNVEEQPKLDHSIIAGGSIIVSPIPNDSQPTLTVSKELPKSIQETIRSASAAAANAESPPGGQPDAAESNESKQKPRRHTSRRRKGEDNTSVTTEKPFTLQ